MVKQKVLIYCGVVSIEGSGRCQASAPPPPDFWGEKKINQNWKTKKIICQLLITAILIIFKNGTIFISVYRTRTQGGSVKMFYNELNISL
jgi:hypothetical protein